MASPDLGACLSAAVNTYKNDPLTHLAATLLVVIVSSVSSGLLTGPMLVGHMRMLRYEEQGNKARIGDVFKGFDDFVPALVAVLISSIAVSIGLFLCVLPGLLIMALVPVTAYLVAVGEQDGIAAIQRGFAVIRANLLSSCLCALVLGIVGSLGALLCGVGVVLTLPITLIGGYHLARQLTEGGALVP